MPRPSTTLDPAALARIKDLAVRARTLVEGTARGMHRSPLHGFSVEFSEYRPYIVGDDLRFLDWRLFARTDRYYVKRFEDETNLRCWCVLDRSRSMQFRGAATPMTKDDYARTLTATLTYMLLGQQDAVGLATFDERLHRFVPARFATGQWHRILVGLEVPTQPTTTRLPDVLTEIAPLLRRRGLVVLISDFLVPLEGLESALGLLVARGHDVCMVRVLDPTEREPELDEPMWVRDMETGRRIHVDPADAVPEYRRRFEEHEQALVSLVRKLAIDFHRTTTDRPLEFALREILQSRERLVATQVRRRASGRT